VPLFGADLDAFEQETFNLIYHLRQPRSEVMSWPTSVRRDMWRRYMKQREFEQRQAGR